MRWDKRKGIRTRSLATGCVLYSNDLTHPEPGCPTSHVASTMSTIFPFDGKPLRCFSGEQHGAGASGRLKSKQTRQAACLNWHRRSSCRTHEAPVCLFLTSARPGRDSLKGKGGGEEATTLLVTSLHPCPVLYRKH